MNARILTTTAVIAAFSGSLPVLAADQQLINLLMPDAKVVAGVNADQAKASPFGQYILQQMQTQDRHLRELSLQTGFDPSKDVQELLVATSGEPGKEKGLALARGNFNVAGITGAATQHGGIVETYGGATLVQDPKRTVAFAFVNTTMAIAGDLANVKAAIDRLKSPSALPAALLSQINEWSNSQDAWAITTVPPNSLSPRANAPKIPGVGPGQDAFQNIQKAAGGVRFGSTVTAKVQGETDGPQSAQQMADALKLLVSFAQMQGNADQTVKALLQAFNISAQGNLVNITASLPSDQFLLIVAAKKNGPGSRRVERKN